MQWPSMVRHGHKSSRRCISQSYYHSYMSLTQKQELQDVIYQIIVTSPKMCIQHSAFRDLIQSATYAKHIGGIIIDEAHCISQWGDKFRPEYSNLISLRSLVPLGVPIYATTATAPPLVLEDIRRNLGIEGDKSFHLNLGNDHPNIVSKVQYMKSANDFDALRFLAEGVRTTDELQWGIVFTNSILHSQITCREFWKMIPPELHGQVAFLHSKRSAQSRAKVLELYHKGQIKILFATECGGMVSHHRSFLIKIWSLMCL